MHPLAEKGVGGEVVEGVVHIAHVPLEGKAQTAVGGWHRHHRVGGGFLGDGDRTGKAREYDGVELAQEIDRRKIYVAAVAVRSVFAGLASVV